MSADMPVVLSLGLGVDSVSILLRWIHDPDSRDFDLSNLTVVTAMVGDEFDETVRLTETYILPLMRQHNIRYAQVARKASQSDGIAILSDTRQPQRLFSEGSYKLSDEMLDNGLVPQRAGGRKCSVKSKGVPLDRFIKSVVGDRPFRHIIGFEKTEGRRATRDQVASARTGFFPPGQRQAEFPLIEWGWDRQDCLDYICTTLGGIEWVRSCCVYCPFALGNKDSVAALIRRFQTEPHHATDALMMEATAMALNPTQTLTPGGLFALVPETMHESFSSQRDTKEHAVIEVRRILRPKRSNPTVAANSARSIRTVFTGTRDTAHEHLAELALQNPEAHMERGHNRDSTQRLWVQRRKTTMPCAEHFYTVTPTTPADKQRPDFEKWWDDITGATPTLDLVLSST
jgi:hypothetical protein